ncbi:uncharacterized protein LOC120423292 [Culex pipiens pallens]|uniref:uncharacterized protein LOC120423292 n=1 Tax=Culex pipiens pallens TaxID=42434 RepID=UPI0019538718|nr:uncharacterized protein LOC120423292 [Culex pipiens pallens]
MKFLILIAVLGISGCLAEYNKQQMRKIMDAARPCYQKLDIPTDSDMLERLAYRKNVTYSEKEVEFMLCFQQNFGVYDTEGNLRPDAMVEFCMKNPKMDRTQVTEAINLCVKKCNDLPLLERARKIYDCFFDSKQAWF